MLSVCQKRHFAGHAETYLKDNSLHFRNLHLCFLLNKFIKAMHDPWWMNKVVIQYMNTWNLETKLSIFLLGFLSDWIFSSFCKNCMLSSLPNITYSPSWYFWHFSFVYGHLNISPRRGEEFPSEHPKSLCSGCPLSCHLQDPNEVYWQGS